MPMDSFLSKEKCTGIFKCLARNNSTSKQDELNEVHFLAVILTSTPQSLYFFYFLMMYTHFPNCCCCVYLPTYIKENTGADCKNASNELRLPLLRPLHCQTTWQKTRKDCGWSRPAGQCSINSLEEEAKNCSFKRSKHSVDVTARSRAT